MPKQPFKPLTTSAIKWVIATFGRACNQTMAYRMARELREARRIIKELNRGKKAVQNLSGASVLGEHGRRPGNDA